MFLPIKNTGYINISGRGRVVERRHYRQLQLYTELLFRHMVGIQSL